MNYSEITNEVLEILNIIIPRAFDMHQEFEEEKQKFPELSNPHEELKRDELALKSQNLKIAAMVSEELRNSLPALIDNVPLWFKGTEKPKAELFWVISPYEFNIMGPAIISIALEHALYNLQIGVLANLTSGEIITGAVGQGSQMENQVFTANNNELSPQASVVQFVIPPAKAHGPNASVYLAIKNKFKVSIMTNKVAENVPYFITLVARGMVDLVMATGFQYHDVAASICIAEQAGATVFDFEDKKGIYGGEYLACCSHVIYKQIHDVLKEKTDN